MRSQIENFSVVWRPTTISLTKKLESSQKRAIKWILSEENFRYSTEQCIHKCKAVDILPLARMFNLNDLFYFRKAINNLVPVSLPTYVHSTRARLRHCHIDGQSLVCSIFPRSSQSTIHSSGPLSKSYFYDRTHLLWNSLPLEIRQIGKLP